MNQLQSIYNSPFKDSRSHPIHTCFPIIASNDKIFLMCFDTSWDSTERRLCRTLRHLPTRVPYNTMWKMTFCNSTQRALCWLLRHIPPWVPNRVHCIMSSFWLRNSRRRRELPTESQRLPSFAAVLYLVTLKFQLTVVLSVVVPYHKGPKGDSAMTIAII